MFSSKRMGAALLACASLVLMLGVVAGAANPRFQATLTLPYAVVWGSARLPAGTYRLSCANGCQTGVLTITRSDGSKPTYVIGQPGDTPAVNAASVLAVETIGDTHVVHTLHVGGSDIEMVFAMPKTPRSLETRKNKPTYIALK